MRGQHPNYSIVEIVQNTKRTPGDARRLAVTQSPPSTNAGMKNFKMNKMTII